MNTETYITAITILGSVVTGGGLLKVLQWTTANKQTVADGWQGYAKDLEMRMDKLETNYERKIKELEDLLVAKNKEIYDLQAQVARQDDELRTLRHLVKNMQHTQQIQEENKKAEVKQAKNDLHVAVEDNLNSITP